MTLWTYHRIYHKKHTNHLPRFAPWFFKKSFMDKFHQDHPWAFVVRLGIFCPPFFVAAFASFIRPYPEKPHYREVPGEEGFGNELSWDCFMTFVLFGWVRRFSLKRGFDRFWTGNDSGNLGVRKCGFESLSKMISTLQNPWKSLMGWDFHIALSCGSIGYFGCGSWSLKNHLINEQQDTSGQVFQADERSGDNTVDGRNPAPVEMHKAL